MPRALPNLQRRTLTLETGQRTIDIPLDGAGHLRRSVTVDNYAFTRAAAGTSSAGQFKGHAAVFDSRTWIGSRRYGFWEEIAPAAFAKTIRESDVRFLDQHDPARLLARNTNGTLDLAEDKIGLAVAADIADTTVGRDVAVLLERRDLTQMSFAFDMIDYTWRTLDDGTEVLRHNEVQLWDVATVTYPAYDDTDAALRGDLLACARSQGFDALHLQRLAERLANPDDDLVAALRSLATEVRDEPAKTTRDDDPADRPAETTGTRDTAHPLAVRQLAARMASLEGAF